MKKDTGTVKGIIKSENADEELPPSAVQVDPARVRVPCALEAGPASSRRAQKSSCIVTWRARCAFPQCSTLQRSMECLYGEEGTRRAES